MLQIIHKKELLDFLNIQEIKMFEDLQLILRKLNKFSNLTKLIDGNDYWISQVYDSVWPFFINSEKIFDNKKYIDIGSGCGFPGLAYSITHPNSKVYLLDSSKKKTDALKIIVEELNLKDRVFIIKDRIENFAHNPKYRNYFDIGSTRAVSSPSTVAEYILPMLNNKGTGILYCGKWTKEDEKKIYKSLKILNGKIQEIINKSLPGNKGDRNIIFIKPIENCPSKYPRLNGKPSKYPL